MSAIGTSDHPEVGSPPGDRVLRVLLVEDIETDRADVVKALTKICSSVDIRPDIVTAVTYDDAYRLMAGTFFDLYIIDLVLHEGLPGDTEGWEGLWLLQDLQELGLQAQSAVVVLSGFGTPTVAALTLSKFAALRYWEKSGVVLEQELAALFRERNYFGLRLGVSSEVSWSQMVKSLGKGQLPTGPFPIAEEVASFELEHLFRRVFSDYSEIAVRPLLGGHSGAGVVRVDRARGNSKLAAIAAKYCAAPLARSEATNFQIIDEYMESHQSTRLVDSAFGRYLGVLEYNFVGADAKSLVSFANFYHDADELAIQRALARLFGESSRLFYDESNRRFEREFNLKDYYLNALGYSVDTIAQAFSFKFGAFPYEETVSFIEAPRRLPHPVTALRTLNLEFSVDTWCCPTHGDLHSGNLLIDAASSQPWLLDFAGSGYGHWARDFAALECSIKFELLPAVSLGSLFEMEDFLAYGEEFGASAVLRRIDPSVNRAAETVAEIRRQARVLSSPYAAVSAERDYYVALFFTTLNYLRFHWRLKSKVRKNQVLMAAAIALEKVMEGGSHGAKQD
jgi:hypothetical protein